MLKIHNLLQRVDKLKKRFGQTVITEEVPTGRLSNEERFIQKVTRIIQRHLTDPQFSVDQLSSILHLSRSQLYRKLHAITGKGPKAFIRLVRLTEARKLLHQQNLTISEVCYGVGFSNPSYFSTSFKNTVGYSPMQASGRQKES
jgi:AraC-like DNA-binding protein